MEVYLRPDVGDRFPKRCFLARSGPLRFALDDDPVSGDGSGPLDHPVEVVVVDELPRTLRVVITTRFVRLVVFVGREDLHVASIHAAWLGTAPDRAPDPSASLRVAPGTPLEELERRGGARRVAGEADWVRFEGWIDGSALGLVYVPEPFVASGGEGLVTESAVIVSATGEVIARFLETQDAPANPPFLFEVQPLPGAPAGLQAIRLRGESVEARGFVPLASFQKKPSGRPITRILRRHADNPDHVLGSARAVLAAGSGLYTAAGDRVGVTLVDTPVYLPSQPIGGAGPLRQVRISVPPFGLVLSRARWSDLRP